MLGTILTLNPHWNMVLGENQQDIYFMHKSDVRKGKERISVGVPVQFDTAPPFPGKKHPRAINAVVGDVGASAPAPVSPKVSL